jgi:ParB family chromosome partitioning protein
MATIQEHIDKIKNEKDIFTKTRLIQSAIQDGMKGKDIASKLAVKPSYLSNLLRILKLPEIIIDGYYSNTISLSHLIVLSRLKTEDDLVSVYEKILSENMTVLQLDEVVREKLYSLDSKGTKIPQEIKNKIIEKYRRLGEKVHVQVTQTQIQAKVVIVSKGNRIETTEFLEKLSEIG